MKITNTTYGANAKTFDFVLNGKAKDGVPPTGHVAAGESDDLDVNMDVEAARIKALVSAGEISVPGGVAAKIEKATNAVPAAKP